MCGIMGYVGERQAVPYLVQGLRRLEYRGYDSAGVACYTEHQFSVVKESGKLDRVEEALGRAPLKGFVGIGHTRWATHGRPNAINAHPHRVEHVVLVHNGIIENHEELRDELEAQGRTLISETDSELFGHLVVSLEKNGMDFFEAVRTSFLRLRGSCTIVIVSDGHPETIVAIRNGTPLVAAHSTTAQGSFVASDAQALLDHTKDILFLENEEMVVATKEKISIYNINFSLKAQKPIFRDPQHLDWSAQQIEKDGFEHFMLKEIHEQPRAILDTLDALVDRENNTPVFHGLDRLVKSIQSIHLIGCGTALHAGLVARYFLESALGIPVSVELASEYRYRDPIVNRHTLVIAISQSGETADTLAALREAKARGAHTAAICNVRGSTLSREAEQIWYTHAGPEIGVASTKAFTTQVLILMLLSQAWRHLTRPDSQVFDVQSFLRIPHLIQSVLEKSEEIRSVARKHLKSKSILYIGRGPHFPVSLEGALKMKEISYLHAEGYPAGELKHGPIALVDSEVSIVVIAPRDRLYEKTLSNLQEVKARGGRIVGIGQTDDAKFSQLCESYIGLPFQGDATDALLATVPLQLLAYYMALELGRDVDQPRNLAKSVTVE